MGSNPSEPTILARRVEYIETYLAVYFILGHNFQAPVAQEEEHPPCKRERGFSTNPCGSILEKKKAKDVNVKSEW